MDRMGMDREKVTVEMNKEIAVMELAEIKSCVILGKDLILPGNFY
jgi:hypothetical protein